ncbi:equilibrative nucleoside transporter 1 [Drosophila nasuta]|uniref:equilibrative nucleoside transporter 1 n=1 Tax=Drosophila nasuta TaxID=42062 RepID=UPI00295E6186|nr:equilibrative nucleoside transporter 1 [Drosophila nasuta]
MGDRKGEESPFISSKKPVTLNPSWESQMQPDPNINGKGSVSMMSKIGASLQQPPLDKYKIVFLIFMLHGLGTLMPWNMFITAKSYFEDFKLNNTIKTETKYSENFMQNMGFAAQIPNVLFNWINIFINLGGDLTSRIVYTILLEIVILIVTVVLAMLDSYEWPGIFFWTTMCTVVIINMCNGIYQSTIYGLVASLPPKYTGAVVLGSNISGCFCTIMSILCSEFFESPRTSAIYYFVTAILVLLLCFDTYFALPLNKFFRHYEMLSKQNDKNSSASKTPLKVPYWQIFKKASPQLFNIFFTFFVTLAVFPAVHSDIKRSDDFILGEKYFTLVTCFLTFNVFAMLGSLVTSWIQWPKPKFLVVPVVLRVAFIPLMILCNYNPNGHKRTLPVLISNEWVYWIIAIIMSFSSGYLSSLGMMYAPQTVNTKYQITAGMFAAAFLVSGIFAGVLFSYLCPLFLTL